jgi:hypothetical protein
MIAGVGIGETYNSEEFYVRINPSYSFLVCSLLKTARVVNLLSTDNITLR